MATHSLRGALAPLLTTMLAERKARSGAPHRTGARVLRNSTEEGTFEHRFFSPPAKGETDRVLRAARRILDAGRQMRSEARAGARVLTVQEQLLTRLTSASVRVLEEILTLARLNHGRVFPSYDHLARATSLGRATVARAIAILEAIGFLERRRRFRRIEDSEGPGPRYEQTSNVYRAILPAGIAAYLPRWMRPAPLPDDVTQRESERQDDMRLMQKQAARTGKGAMMLDNALARIDAALQRRERESHNDTEPLTESNLNQLKDELA